MKAFYIIIMCIFLPSLAYSQCTCIGGASVGGLTPSVGAEDAGVLKEDNLSLGLFYKNGFGDKFFTGSEQTGSGTVKEYGFQYLGLSAGYGISSDFTLEMDLGYFLNKYQQYEKYKDESSGFSHISTVIKYNVYSARAKEFEYSVGLGGRAPINAGGDSVPQTVLPSNGAYGASAISFLHKGFKNLGLHFFLINRFEINAENENGYLIGPALSNSLFVTQNVMSEAYVAVEFRGDIRAYNKYAGADLPNSGGFQLTLAPRISYKYEGYDFSASLDYPIYGHYNGTQLVNNYSFGINITKRIKL